MDYMTTEAIQYDMEYRKKVKWDYFEQNLKQTSKLNEQQERKIFNYVWDEFGRGEAGRYFDQIVELFEDCSKLN